MEDRMDRSIAQLRELVSSNILNWVAKRCYRGKRKQDLTEEEGSESWFEENDRIDRCGEI